MIDENYKVTTVIFKLLRELFVCVQSSKLRKQSWGFF
jgi:hypothetical protein